ncbi:MAG: FHA domain-containing protein [Planctomycetes bacterium]|nr:FHA domain-containing protein [Planctomycetota bacterium]
MPYLEIKLGPDTLLVPFVGRIDYVIGRLPKADIQLRDMKVSRLHTQLFIDSRGRAFVRDLGSSGGTVFNNVRLRSGAIAPLTMGSKVRIGDARITFYDQEPPVNAIKPPSKSDPRGLVRTNDRERTFAAEATVLAADKVSAETENGPAEAPPEIDPMVFADGAIPPSGAQPSVPAAPATGKAAPAKPPAAPAKPPQRKRDTGIVQAPWEAADSNRHQAPKGEKRVTIPPPTRGGAKPPSGKMPPPMQTAEIDETGQFHEAMPSPGGPTQYSPPPPRPLPARPAAPEKPGERPGTANFRNAKPAATPSVRAPESPLAAPEEMDFGDAADAFVPPPPPPKPAAPIADDDDAPVSTGMPTVKLDRSALLARRAAEEDAAKKQDEESPRIPTATVKPAPAPAVDAEDEPAPRIGLAPGERPPAPALDDLIDEVKDQAAQEVAEKAETGEDEESLTDEQIAVYLGGSASGRFDAVDFGDESGKSDDDVDEVAIRSKVAAPADEDLDLDDQSVPAAHAPQTDEPPAEVAHVNTSMLGQTTAIKEEPVSDTPSEPVPEYSAADQEKDTPPPPSRTGAVADQGFSKPHKTRKLMKRRTEKVTDRTKTPPPESKPTEMVVPSEARFGDAPIGGGAKTIFIPKPADAKVTRGSAPVSKKDESGDDDDTSRAPVQARKVEDLGHGPGGDTVALPPDMMKQLRQELAAKDKAPRTAPPAAKPTIGESPTVKRPPTDGDDSEEEEFILDDNYAFFTPPPPTRKAAAEAAKAGQEDLIDANDFNAESEKLPPEKRAKPAGDPDTIVD